MSSRNDSINAWRARRYDKIAAIKVATGCADCGYDAHPAALDFDHRPDEEKLFEVSTQRSRAWHKIEAEMAKCDVVCSNCHRIRTWNRRKGL